jgi:hypothetical protein
MAASRLPLPPDQPLKQDTASLADNLEAVGRPTYNALSLLYPSCS